MKRNIDVIILLIAIVGWALLIGVVLSESNDYELYEHYKKENYENRDRLMDTLTKMRSVEKQRDSLESLVINHMRTEHNTIIVFLKK